MARHRADALFASFQTTGDPRALAQVFDLLAPELLLVAAHFARGGAEAEDLLQSTFLAAIEGAARWHADRPVTPWLVGILVNQARRQRRRLRTPAGSEASPLLADDDPSLAAEMHEFAEHAARALADLPQPYRHVLNLRWVHGLQPLEIAHSLGCPPDTVKTQLRRGLELLRQALPATFAFASLTSLLTAGSGLVAVREVITSRALDVSATLGTGPAVRAVARGARRSSAAGATVVALALTVAAGALAWHRWRGVEPPVQTPPGSVAVAQDTVAEDLGATRGPSRTPLPPIVDGAAAPMLELRVTFAADGSPARSARVRLLPIEVADPELRERIVVLDDDGRARVQVEPGRLRLIADRGGETITTLDAGATTVAEIKIPAGIGVTGRVVDAADRPIAGASVWLSKPGLADDILEVTSTTADGRFALRDVEPGRCLAALAEGRACSMLVPIVGDESTYTLRLSDAGQTLSGQVHDGDDQPVRDACVMIGQSFSTAAVDHGQSSRPPALWLRTDAEGRFATSSIPIGWSEAPLWVGAPGYAHSAQTVRLQTGTPLRVRLGRGATLRGRVLDDDGRPAAGVRIEVANWLSDPVRHVPIGPSWRRSVVWTGADGCYTLRGLRPGRAGVRALTAGADRAAGMLDLGEGVEYEWNANVAPPVTLRGRLLGEDGRPLPAWRVQVEAEHGRVRPRSVVTDDAGRFQVPDCDRCGHVVSLFDPASAHLAPVLRRLVAAGKEDLELTVADALRPRTSLSGDLVDAGGAPAARVVLFAHRSQGYARTRSDAAGHFDLGPLASGRGILFVIGDAGIPLLRQDVEVGADAEVDLGTIPLPAVGTLRVLARDPMGATVTRGAVTLHDARDRWFGSTRLGALADPGVALTAGHYTLTTTDGLAMQIRAVDIEPGRVTTVELATSPGVKRRITLAHPYDGVDLELAWTWRRASGEVVGRIVTRWTRAPGDDSTAWCWLTPGTYDAEVASSQGLHAHARAHVADLVPDDTPIHLEFR